MIISQSLKLLLNRRVKGIRVYWIARYCILLLMMSTPFIYGLYSGGLPVHDPARQQIFAYILIGAMFATAAFQMLLSILAGGLLQAEPENFQRTASGQILAYRFTVKELAILLVSAFLAICLALQIPSTVSWGGLPVGFYVAVGITSIVCGFLGRSRNAHKRQESVNPSKNS